MLDNIREWISDNLRYILLGLAVILVVVIAFFAVRLVMSFGSSGDSQSSPQTEAGSAAGGSSQTDGADGQTEDAQAETSGTSSGDNTQTGSAGALTRDQADVLDAAQRYWTAISEKDYDTLEELCQKTYDEEARAEVDAIDVAVESYDGITTYSKPGLTDGSYVVYVYMELKLTGISTEGPTLRELYMEPGTDGSLVIVQPDDYTAEISAYTSERQKDSDVQALIQDVNDTLAQRCEEDEQLKQYIESVSTGTTDASSDSSSGETNSSDAQSAATGTMKINVEGGANVRSEASTDGTVYGSLPNGTTVQVVENLDSGWSKIQYVNTEGTTIEGYVMTQYLAAE